MCVSNCEEYVSFRLLENFLMLPVPFGSLWRVLRPRRYPGTGTVWIGYPQPGYQKDVRYSSGDSTRKEVFLKSTVLFVIMQSK